MTTTKLIALAIAAVTLACGAAQAEEIPTINVMIKGADLLDPAAVKTIELRIRKAAIKVCQTPQQSSQGLLTYDRPCFVKARDNALAGLKTEIASARTAKGEHTLVLAAPAHP
ncbi:UrcA family protein [Novosphingobium hassiacum]|uniref:UrcA family protein n=1 Tax=Novosphingobium hassiacum TaxID=173676 RepID=A0A7W5ZYI3_9SPHN|nr:UrcA family protein [Novosphingobium hassiacum]MBB3860040.1 UrcA family protein [Novosphingobium hassiacum]